MIINQLESSQSLKRFAQPAYQTDLETTQNILLIDNTQATLQQSPNMIFDLNHKTLNISQKPSY